MIKAFARLTLWLTLGFIIGLVVLVWLLLPRHIPEAVTCPRGTDPRVAFQQEPRALSLILSDCLVSSGSTLEIRTWYDTQPFSPAADFPSFPRWTAGRLSFTIQREVTLEPAGLHPELGIPQGDVHMRTAILVQTRYTFAW
jgi:hypothetical protein